MIRVSCRCSTSGTRPGQFQRREKVTGCHITVTDWDTKRIAAGEIPPGHYSKRQLREMKEALIKELKGKL